MRICLTGEDHFGDEIFLLQIVQCIFYLFNELPNWSVSDHICREKGVHRRNDHRPLDKHLYLIIVVCINVRIQKYIPNSNEQLIFATITE